MSSMAVPDLRNLLVEICDRAHRFDLDREGIEQRGEQTIELGRLRAEVVGLRVQIETLEEELAELRELREVRAAMRRVGGK